MTEASMDTTSILLVSKERSAPDLACGEDYGWQVASVSSGWEALDRVQSGPGPDLVLLDWARGDSDGLHTLRWLRRVRPHLPVLVLARFEDLNQKVEAIRLGAQDYLVGPFSPRQLEAAIQRTLLQRAGGGESEILADEIEQIGDDMFFVAACPSMRQLRAQAELLAQVNAPVLIMGEHGSGKALAARLIHRLSVRSGFRFLQLHCATLPGDVLESELFGASNGNGASKPGKLELCQRGTLFLNELTEMPMGLQAKLLHVLQEGHFVRRGGDDRVELDVRILAATHVDIEQAIAERKLREDLYYRLSAFTVHVPALRQRKEEIPLLLSHFMNQLARRYGLPARILSPAASEACRRHSWPGNLTELEKFAKRYLVIGDGGPGVEPLDRDSDMAFWNAYLPQIAEEGEAGPESSEPGIFGLKSLVHSVKVEAEKNAITSALEQVRWNRKAAARMLKVSYRTLLYKIEQYHMSPPASPVPAYENENGNGNGGSYRERLYKTERALHPGSLKKHLSV